MNKLTMSVAATAVILANIMLVSPSIAQETDEPIRLEATIRGNKEQPRVLSIVPWQLPKYRNIEGTLSWQPVNSQPQLIERNRFLRRVALSQQFNGVVPTTTSDGQAAEK